MMKIIEAKTTLQLENIKRLYEEAFPAEQRMPFTTLVNTQTAGGVEILSIENATGDFYGLAIMFVDAKAALLAYFAIAPEKRGGGIGSKVLKLLEERYYDKHFCLEIESTKVAADNAEQRRCRKAFYLRNGMIEADFGVRLFGVEMEILSNHAGLTYDDYLAPYCRVFGKDCGRNIAKIC